MPITVRLCGISVFPECVHSLQKPFITLTNRARKRREMEAQLKTQTRPDSMAALLRWMAGTREARRKADLKPMQEGGGMTSS